MRDNFKSSKQKIYLNFYVFFLINFAKAENWFWIIISIHKKLNYEICIAFPFVKRFIKEQRIQSKLSWHLIWKKSRTASQFCFGEVVMVVNASVASPSICTLERDKSLSVKTIMSYEWILVRGHSMTMWTKISLQIRILPQKTFCPNLIPKDLPSTLLIKNILCAHHYNPLLIRNHSRV